MTYYLKPGARGDGVGRFERGEYKGPRTGTRPLSRHRNAVAVLAHTACSTSSLGTASFARSGEPAECVGFCQRGCRVACSLQAANRLFSLVEASNMIGTDGCVPMCVSVLQHRDVMCQMQAGCGGSCHGGIVCDSSCSRKGWRLQVAILIDSLDGRNLQIWAVQGTCAEDMLLCSLALLCRGVVSAAVCGPLPSFQKRL